MSTPRAATAFTSELDMLVRARYPLLYLVSWEEARVDGMLEELATQHGKHLLEWSVTRGLRRTGGVRGGAPVEAQRDPIKALQAIEKLPEPSLIVLKDFHPYLEQPEVVRALREAGQLIKASFSTVVILAPVLRVPPELEKELTVLDVPLPDVLDLRDLLREIVQVVRASKKATIELTNRDGELLLRAAQGLTLAEAENAFAKAIAADGKLAAEDIDLVLAEKRQIIRKTGLLEYISSGENAATVGGLPYLKAWLTRRGAAFSDEARRFGLPEPKGLLLLGVQGCGKSLTAKAIANQWHLPLLRLDLGRIFAGLIGSSEDNVRRAIRIAESVAPAVLWIDEIEKGLSGSTSSGSVDGGVTARVFATILTWMQEKTAPVFVVATANRIAELPPELLRKGRFDEIFFIDLPSARERQDILRIHLSRRGRDPSKFDLPALAAAAVGYSGAELEQAVIAGLYAAFEERSDLAQHHVATALAESPPLSATMREDLGRLRAWAQTRTRPASPDDDDAGALAEAP
ncbi:MAG: AAA family ATPase [Kofleriaceae bacterium]|jgi:SpoVK/Ycf46/Vps4 family AAA+-type ATPase|nr:AAA family ATPase [Kofleriaceae bacterium]MBP9202550.1 AAA family ATPase [Kofleriaceae bacterium]